MAGIAASFGLGIGLIFLWELMNSAIRRPKDLVESLGITPIAVLPYLPTPRSTRNRKIVTYAVIGAFLLGIPAALAAIHQFYLPLDLLVEKVVDRFSV